ncbi:helix-turn-helix domain-containing protein [Bradyrhizobium iriomotense]|uniref:helix-turn-helix domain-containing protein n=1 Tax=Bradyrhizobium iriomotense TaxID=441950 RepID=UPI001B8A351B|nr:helix-turn-helix domain-containing protein [Bradyrhizobium iriomotense]MBR0787393.1 helix-turn-helix domain-containing protein [Bradyrhizobium iriomotense]
MPNSKANHTRALFEWLNRVLADAELSPNAFKVAFTIGQRFNRRHGGAAWPSLRTIAADIGVDEATAVRAVRQLCERGHLLVEPGKRGRGHSNRYRMSKAGKPAQAQVKAVQKPAHLQVLRSGRKPAPVSLKPARAQLNHLEPSMGTPTASPKGERERERSLAVIPGAPEPDGGAREGLQEDRFAELLAIWQRPWGDDDTDACLAFALVCRDAHPDDIIASARAWVAAADDPRFLKPLAKWLTKGLWRKPPPQRRPTRNAGKVSLSKLMNDLE